MRQSGIDKEDIEKYMIPNKLKEEIENILEIENEDAKLYNIISKVKPISELYQSKLELIEEENNNYRLNMKK